MLKSLGFVVGLALAHCAAAVEWPQIELEERFAGFDRPVALTHAGDGSGRLFVADVGQNSYEEVNFQPASSRGGENYGWRVMEGLHCFNPDPCDSSGLVLPVVEYDHSLGCSITGGQVYRGARWPRLDGHYLYGDYCSGRIWGLCRTAGGWEHRQLADTGLQISTFGIDELGVVHVVDRSSGRLYAITDIDRLSRDPTTIPVQAAP